MMGALLALSSHSANLAIRGALGSIHEIETDDRAELLQQIVQLQPDVLLLNAYHAGSQEVLATYRGVAPWGYIVLIYQQLADLQFTDHVDEVWPVAQLADSAVKVLLRLAKLNRYHTESGKMCSLTCNSEEASNQSCYKRLESFLVNGRFISPGIWGRRFFVERSLLLQQSLQPAGISSITAWPGTFPVGVDIVKHPNDSSLVLTDDLRLALEKIGLRLEPLHGNGISLLSLRFEGAFFPIAVVNQEKIPPSHAQHVAERAASWMGSYGDQDRDATAKLFQSFAYQFSSTLSSQYEMALHSFGQCAFCRDTVNDQAYVNSLSSALGVGVILLDTECGVKYASELAVRLLASESIQDDATDTKLPLLGKIVERVKNVRYKAGLKFVLEVSDNKRLAVSVGKATNVDGDSPGYVISVQDQTGSQELELEARLRERLASVGELAAGMAHEIRNPLTSIRGFMQLLRQRLVEGQMKAETRYADYVLEEIDRANHVVTSFLSLAKPRDEIWLLVDVNELLAKMLQLMENQAMLKGVYMTWQFMPSIPLIRGKPEALMQVFLNIATNALQATPKGGSVHILTRAQGDNVLVSVQDSGTGISSDVQSRIFNPFYSTKEGGTGLGLALCQKIVEEHRGEIQVESTLGLGSCFIVCLPIASASAEAENALIDTYN